MLWGAILANIIGFDKRVRAVLSDKSDESDESDKSDKSDKSDGADKSDKSDGICPQERYLHTTLGIIM